MRTSHGFARLVGFSDGVVAIAITLLILPLVESAGDWKGDVGLFIAEHQFQLLVFVLTFLVIGNFWVLHHQLYEKAVSYSTPLLWANLVWLMSIVFLPMPTELLASDGNNRTSHALYIGTMVVTAAASLVQQVILIRSPELQADAARGTLRALPQVTTLVALILAFGLSIAVPSIGLWSLLLLVLSHRIEAVVASRRRRRAGGA